MAAPLARFQELLRELFQFDCADLDFGIYRILNHKRDVIRQFIDKDLPEAVQDELDSGQAADQEHALEALKAREEEVRKYFGDDALNPDGALDRDLHGTKLGKDYLEAQEAAKGVRGTDAMTTEAFNHLYQFFKRYYEDGDFISKRRYSKQHRYAIPYNGEEVHFHWATSDQYYVKSAEHFRDYQFRSMSGVTVSFQLRTVDVEHDNVKAAHRFFIAQADATSWNNAARRFIIPFQYRPLTPSEQARYAGSPENGTQSRLLDHAATEIRNVAAAWADCLTALNEERPAGRAEDGLPLLEHHLRRYTRRNTSDFFIHKDLYGFLTRELDSYVKNEVLLLDTVQAGSAERAEGWFQMMSLLRSVGSRIIAFLVQIEDFQKMLWEKRKFVVETNYIIAVGQVPSVFYTDIAGAESQWKEWRELLHCDVPVLRREEFLEGHPTLPLDTRHFPRSFLDRVLASFSDLGDATDGRLVHGDNFQALSLMESSYRARVNCVYIDPPYNTGDSEILYKNEYLRSSWLTLMNDRIHCVRTLFSDDPVIFIAIDDFEMANLAQLLDTQYPELRREVIIVNHHPQGGKATTLSQTHEYMFVCVNVGSPRRLEGAATSEEVERRSFRRAGTAESNYRRSRPNSFYAILADPESSRIVGAEPPVPLGSPYPMEDTEEGYRRIYPLGGHGTERVWRRAYSSVGELINGGRLVVQNGQSVYQLIAPDEASRALFSNWVDKRYNAGIHGANLVRDMMGEQNPFSYPKSVYTVRDALYSADLQDDSEILDFFAGSGTTGHATIALNREDGRRRKFAMVEVADHFDRILMPRIKKVIYAPEWKDGRPRRDATKLEAERTPRLLQYIRLESYEDALDNIEYSRGAQQLPFVDYDVRYMLGWETKDSDTLLNVEKLSRPFDYTLSVRCNGATERRKVDLPETFNFLIGLRVRTRLVLYRDAGDRRHRYLVLRGKTTAGEEIAVLWRDIGGWDVDDFEQERDWAKEERLTEGADVVYVNGDSAIPGAGSLDPEFKRRMFEEVEA